MRKSVVPWEWRRNYLAKLHEETFYNDRNIFYYGGGYTTAYNYQIHQTVYLELMNM